MRPDLDAVAAYDAAFSGRPAHVLDAEGRPQSFEVDRWRAPLSAVDHELFVSPCDAPTIDVGCGPGRLVAELTARGVHALGLDVSPEAVRQARLRGAPAVRGDVFGDVPEQGEWAFALLADGNLGIGGDPAALLRRLRDVLRPRGRVIAEVGPVGTGLVRGRRRISVDGRLSAPFAWADVGLDAVEALARAARMHVVDVRTVGGRHAVTLVADL